MAIRHPDAGRRGDRKRSRFRSPRVLSLLGAALLALVVASLPAPASAHGVAMSPGSRTYLCYKDMVESGNQTPSNAACADAVAETGTTPLYNWFAVLDSSADGQTVGYIPDGEICSGGHEGPFDFSSYNAARSDWPTTHLTAGSSIEIRYSNWAAHPGDFIVYFTKDSWTPDKPLAWSDLEKVQTVTDPPQEGGAGSDGGAYYWDLQLPNKSGQHIMFIHWTRSDSPEDFYSCSDVVFDGGSGEVTF
jgi:predicted carbohydrate-binding protein with CBM5 and CBM33 domain